MSSTHAYHFLRSQFEAACKMPNLAASHRASRLHGHSYLACVRLAAKETPATEILLQNFDDAIRPLDYAYLNDIISTPSDENIARWIQQHFVQLTPEVATSIDQTAVQSTHHSGVDIDRKGDAHIWRRYRFEAAHWLPHVPAGHQCGRMHGHGFEVILHVNQHLEQDQPMGLDFDRLDQYWQPLYLQLHQHCLNDIKGLENPTSEMLANWIWQQLKPKLPALSWVTVYETHTAGCHYNGRDYRIWKEQFFESAVIQQGRLQGHSYKIRLHLIAELDKIMGWTVDYGEVKQLFRPVYRQLDHHLLDELKGLEATDAIRIAHWIKKQIADQLPQLDRIDLYQHPHYAAQLCWGKEGPALPD